MKKKQLIRIISIVMSIFLVVGIMVINGDPVMAASDSTTGLVYTISNGKAQITGFTAPTGFNGTLTIPSTLGGASVTSIAAYAITWDYGIKSISIPSSVISIGDGGFYACYDLKTINVDPANAYYKTLDNVLFNKSGTKLICCPGGKSGNVMIPDSVTSIGNYAFNYCHDITTITIPNSVVSIGKYVFCSCSSLTGITIPSSVRTIGTNVFGDCNNMQAIQVETGNTAFQSIEGVLYSKNGTQLICCPQGKTGAVKIPNGVTTIIDNAFSSSELTSITIPNSVVSIGNYAFEYSGNLIDLTIPSSVTHIGYGALSYCYSMKAISVDSNNPIYTSVDGVLYSKDKTQVLCCPGGKTGSVAIQSGVTEISSDVFRDCSYLTNVTIPNGVTNIDSGAFSSCYALTNITIPSSVTSIGGYAFYYCTNLKDAYFYGDAPEMGEDVFYDCGAGFNIHYLSTCTGYTNPWNGYPAAPFTAAAGISYRTHVQDIGWQDYVANGATSGTSGQSKRLEAINIKINGVNGGIEYRTHVQDIGWQDWVSNDALSGTNGQSKRLEAIQIRLTGEAASLYDVYYHVHAQNIGWMDWAKNGESAGTAGYSYRLEAIEIVLVKKGDPAPGATEKRFAEPGVPNPVGDTVSYKTHVQDIGWQDYVCDGATSGTIGQAKRMEAIQIKLQNMTGGIEYRTHVQDYGWMNWVGNDALSGTSGESKRLEAIEIRLTGAAADTYDIYYRVHAQNFGWMGWAKNGESAGTAGYSYRLEAVEIVLIPKGTPAPGSTDGAFKQA